MVTQISTTTLMAFRTERFDPQTFRQVITILFLALERSYPLMRSSEIDESRKVGRSGVCSKTSDLYLQKLYLKAGWLRLDYLENNIAGAWLGSLRAKWSAHLKIGFVPIDHHKCAQPFFSHLTHFWIISLPGVN